MNEMHTHNNNIFHPDTENQQKNEFIRKVMDEKKLLFDIL